MPRSRTVRTALAAVATLAVLGFVAGPQAGVSYAIAADPSGSDAADAALSLAVDATPARLPAAGGTTTVRVVLTNDGAQDATWSATDLDLSQRTPGSATPDPRGAQLGEGEQAQDLGPAELRNGHVALAGDWTVRPGAPQVLLVELAVTAGAEPLTVPVEVTVDGATLTASVDVTVAAPALTIDPPGDVARATPTFSGTTDAGQDVPVEVVVDGTVRRTAVVDAAPDAGGGPAVWHLDWPEALPDGSHTVLAEAGGIATPSAVFVVDGTAPALTLDLPPGPTRSALAVSGTTDLPAGSTVVLSDGTTTHEVGVGDAGRYALTWPDAVPDGPWTVTARAVDGAGNATSVSATTAVDTTAPTLTLSVPGLTGSAQPELSGSSDAPTGTVVTLSVDGASATAPVSDDGTFRLVWPVALAEGRRAVEASVADAAGNVATASATTVVDLSAPTLSVDLPAVTRDPTPLVAGTTDVPAGSTVTVDVDGRTRTTQVGGDGRYALLWPQALGDGVHQVVVTVDDGVNIASASAAFTVDTVGPLLTARVTSSRTEALVTVAGTTDVPAGTRVAVTGEGTTVEAAVLPDGTWSLVWPQALAVGAHTLDAVVRDGVGNRTTVPLDVVVEAPVVAFTPPSAAASGRPVLRGTTTAAVGSVVTVTVDGRSFTTHVVDGGSYSIAWPLALSAGAHTVTVSIQTGGRAVTTTGHLVLAASWTDLRDARLPVTGVPVVTTIFSGLLAAALAAYLLAWRRGLVGGARPAAPARIRF